MGPVRRAASLALLLVLCPGLGELVENAILLTTHGHLAHVAADDHHDSSPGPEHGCTGTFHLCPCHTTPSTLLPSTASVAPAPMTGRAGIPGRCRLGSPHPGEVFRPPRVA